MIKEHSKGNLLSVALLISEQEIERAKKKRGKGGQYTLNSTHSFIELGIYRATSK